MDGRTEKGREESEMVGEDEGEDRRETCMRRRSKKTQRGVKMLEKGSECLKPNGHTGGRYPPNEPPPSPHNNPPFAPPPIC